MSDPAHVPTQPAVAHEPSVVCSFTPYSCILLSLSSLPNNLFSHTSRAYSPSPFCVCQTLFLPTPTFQDEQTQLDEEFARQLLLEDEQQYAREQIALRQQQQQQQQQQQFPYAQRTNAPAQYNAPSNGITAQQRQSPPQRDTMSDVQEQFSKLAESTYRFRPPIPPAPHTHTHTHTRAYTRTYQPSLLPTVVTAAEPHQLVALGITFLLLCTVA
jgi:hypothetical protein